MEVLEGLGQAFVVAGQAAEAAQPAERSLHHPVLRQQYEPALGFVVFPKAGNHAATSATDTPS